MKVLNFTFETAHISAEVLCIHAASALRQKAAWLAFKLATTVKARTGLIIYEI
jgi:hypothetical protein